MILGVLAVQGDVREHLGVFHKLGVQTRPVLKPVDLENIKGLVFPGGESTAMWRIMSQSGLVGPLAQALRDGLPALGTCAGMILLAKEITNWPERYFGVLDIAVERNATGRQVDSFEALVNANSLGDIAVVFIRAPLVRRVGSQVQVLARWEGIPVWVRQGRVLGASFHPELTGDTRVHEYFLNLCR